MDPNAVNPLNYRYEAREHISELIQRNTGGEDIARTPSRKSGIIDTMEAFAAE